MTHPIPMCHKNEGKIVRIGGLEPPRLTPLDPKSNAATNYAISASQKGGKNTKKDGCLAVSISRI